MPKRLFFLWSETGSLLFLAKRLKQDGHDVLLYIKDKAAQDVGRGIVPKTTFPIPPRRAIVIFDAIGHGVQGKEFRRLGHGVIGGNPLDKLLEGDRPKGVQIMQDYGIATPESHEFRDINTAIRFLESQTGYWFIKAIGSDTPEAATYDAPVEELQRYLRSLQGKLPHFQLSKRVEGVEISTNGWFDGEKFVQPFDQTLEEKKFLTGNLGPRTGCESNLVWMAQSERLGKRTVGRIEKLLAWEEYVGPIDLNAIIPADGNPLGLEWTARLGFDATQAWCRLFDQSLGEQLEVYAHRQLDNWTHRKDVGATLRVTMPPYPLWEPRVAQKSKGRPLDPRWLTDPDVTIDDVMRGVDGPQMAGMNGQIGTVGTTGTDIAQMRRDLLSLAKDLRVPNKQYRLDPFSRAERDLTELTRLDLLGHGALQLQFKKDGV